MFSYFLLVYVALFLFVPFVFTCVTFQIEYLIKRSSVMAASNTSETVRVILRCRPMNQREIDLNCQVSQYTYPASDMESFFFLCFRQLFQ
jgi:putative component of membrane protein insertase Oxa1/YidC/SpoIIIJ protein YidD